MCVAGISKNTAIDVLYTSNNQYELGQWANILHNAYRCSSDLSATFN